MKPSRFHHYDAVLGADAVLLTSRRGIWAVQWSFIGLLATALFQAVIVSVSGSVALLADTIHNVGDALTALPLWLAFLLARRDSSRRFSYGYGRMEDAAGVVIVVTIAMSAAAAGYQSLARLFHPQPLLYPGWVGVAAAVGFLGNEAVARLRIRVGKEIGSAALVADGHHARVDGLTSLAVLVGAAGAWLGYPVLDPAVGCVITVVIVRLAWAAGKTVLLRLLDAVDPEVLEEIRRTAAQAGGVEDVTETRVRWTGHRLHAELNIAVDPALPVEQGHAIANEVRHRLLHHLRYLSNATIHVDPATASGEVHHRIAEHAHDGLRTHSH
jgi:cation diffusion facilitator family transporter